MDSRAQEIINQITSLSGSYGVSVSVSRTTGATQRNVFGTPIDGITQSFTTNVVIESEKIDLTPTVAGGKAKEVLKLIASSGIFKVGDELRYGTHTYKVEFLQPVPFAGTDVVDFVHAAREVD